MSGEENEAAYTALSIRRSVWKSPYTSRLEIWTNKSEYIRIEHLFRQY